MTCKIRCQCLADVLEIHAKLDASARSIKLLTDLSHPIGHKHACSDCAFSLHVKIRYMAVRMGIFVIVIVHLGSARAKMRRSGVEAIKSFLSCRAKTDT